MTTSTTMKTLSESSHALVWKPQKFRSSLWKGFKRWLAGYFSYRHQWVRRAIGGHWEHRCRYFPLEWHWCYVPTCSRKSEAEMLKQFLMLSVDDVENHHEFKFAAIVNPTCCEHWER